jgi:hypothetical protein
MDFFCVAEACFSSRSIAQPRYRLTIALADVISERRADAQPGSSA